VLERPPQRDSGRDRDRLEDAGVRTKSGRGRIVAAVRWSAWAEASRARCARRAGRLARAFRVQAEVADFVQTVGQDVLDEAAQKLDRSERAVLPSLVRNVMASSVTATNLLFEMATHGVTPEVAKNEASFSERFFRIDEPVAFGEAPHEPVEALWVGESSKRENTPRACKRRSEAIILPRSSAPITFTGKRYFWLEVSIGRLQYESAGGHDGMHVRMQTQSRSTYAAHLTPSVAGKPRLAAQALSAAAKERVVESRGRNSPAFAARSMLKTTWKCAPQEPLGARTDPSLCARA